MRILLISMDGMRSDSLSGIPAVEQMKREASFCINGRTVFPSVTLPCHMSMFHSVEPSRHGITTNIFMPQVRPINGLLEVLKSHGKKSAFFYSWEELRDVSRPASLVQSVYVSQKLIGDIHKTDDQVTDYAISCLKDDSVDFIFLYLHGPDSAGHKFGWMSSEYLDAVRNAWKNAARIMALLGEDDAVIITADHGGHDRIHGTDMDVDMTVPFFFRGRPFVPGKELKDVNILQIAPTIAALFGIEPDEEWEGSSLI